MSQVVMDSPSEDAWRLKLLNWSTAALAIAALATLLLRLWLRNDIPAPIGQALILLAAVWRTGPYRARSVILICGLLAFETHSLLYVGYTTETTLIALSAVITSALLLDARWVVGSWLASTLILLVFGNLMGTGILPAIFDSQVIYAESRPIMLRTTSTYLVISGIMGAGVVSLLSRLSKSLGETRDMISELTEAGLERERSEVAYRKLEEQLRQSQKLEAMGNLTGGVAHGFNNLLTVILGNLELIADEVNDREKTREMAFQAKNAAISAATLTQRLLAFSRKQMLRSDVVRIEDLLSELEGVLRKTMTHMVKIERGTSVAKSKCIVDRVQLENVILNLVQNARDAMPDGGRVTIETSDVSVSDQEANEVAEASPGEYVMLSITDTGTGMSSAVLERVFDPFFTTRAVGKGSGLGLSMVYGFVKQTGGYVDIQSEVDKGTTVRVYLPATHERVSKVSSLSRSDGVGEIRG